MNLEGRLLKVDESSLAGWVGEHTGKFLDAAAHTWIYTGDPRLKGKMQRVAERLTAAQLADGDPSIYTEDQRWTSANLWVQRHDLTGLLSYYRASGDESALAAARKIGDLLAATFGERAGQRDLGAIAGEAGIAATAVLEPMCLLYRYTGDPRYLDFARYVGRAYDSPQGPKLLKSLAETGRVLQAGHGKARELIANLTGVLELYRLTGESALLNPVLAAWKDIAAHRVYLTGTTSAGEFFREDEDLAGEEAAAVGEGCATVAWLQLNWQLLRLTGEARYADQIERTVYNQLLGAQDPHNGNICYFAALNGRKRPGAAINCCGLSEPRGIALIPQLTWGELDHSVAVLLYTPGEAVVPIGNELAVALRSVTRFPSDGAVTLTVRPSKPARFPLRLRVPSWTAAFRASVNREAPLAGQPGQFLEINRWWQPGDTVQIDIDLSPRLAPGGRSYPDYVAVERGPQVLALEASLNPGIAHPHRTAPAAAEVAQLHLEDAAASLPKTWAGSQAYSIDGISAGKPQRLVLVPFADAVSYRVWLIRPNRVPVGQVAVTAFASESWSRMGSVSGSISDERPDTYRTTFEGKPDKEDWYAVEMDRPVQFTRVVYRHGKVFDNGGWFDASASKPKIQIRRTRNGPWETLATLDSYPALNGGLVPALRDGEPFAVKLPAPARAVAIRIVGKPGRSFSSCAELAAYAQ